MSQALTVFVAGSALALLVSVWRARLRAGLVRPLNWLQLGTLAVLLSAASATISRSRHAGTGLAVEHGWPKAFLFHWMGERGAVSGGFEPLYFIGNGAFFAGLLLAGWALWRVYEK